MPVGKRAARPSRQRSPCSGWRWVTSTITAGSLRGKCCASQIWQRRRWPPWALTVGPPHTPQKRLPAVPEGERAGIGEAAGLARRQPGADRADLGEAAARRRGAPEVGGEQADAVLLAEEDRVLGQRRAELGDGQDLGARLIVGADQHLQPGHQEHPGPRIGAADARARRHRAGDGRRDRSRRRCSDAAADWTGRPWRLPGRPAGLTLRQAARAATNGRRLARLALGGRKPDIGARELAGGRSTRQPGQVRKEAAVTSTGRVAWPAPFAPATPDPPPGQVRCPTAPPNTPPASPAAGGQRSRALPGPGAHLSAAAPVRADRPGRAGADARPTRCAPAGSRMRSC